MASGVNPISTLQGKVNANGALVVALDGGAANAELVTVTKDAIGTTATDGVVLRNTTDAAAGAQQYSPRLRLRGEGWKTDATAASQTVDFALDVRPVQGTAAPTGTLVLSSSIEGAAYSALATFSTLTGAPSFFSNPATSGMFSVAGPNAGEFVGFHHFHNGASLTFRNSFNELEMWGYNDTSYQPVFTLISTATKNLTQVRKPDDSTSIELYYPSTGLPRIAPEQASGTNVAGVDLEVGGGAGTGTGTPGALSLMAPSTTGSGSSVQSLAEIIKVRGTDVIFNKPIRLADTGAAVAGAGAIRMQNAGQINARNAANSNNITLVDTTSDVVRLGGDGTAVTGIQLQPGTGDIRWGKALVALGGGSSATLGTIGGSGPTTAAQNTWMRVTDSSGAAFWVPAWK